MPILCIRHVTTYHYHQPVAFGEHRMMLVPRDDADQRVLHSDIVITPRPRQVSWTRDQFGNHVATAEFDDRAAELCFVSNICLDHTPAAFRAADIADFARTAPFTYRTGQPSRLAHYLRPLSPDPAVERWSKSFFRPDGSGDTHDLLVAMTQTIAKDFRHVARHERGIQTPAETLARGTGCCRDVAVLMISALRARGIAARFVSGYLHLPDDEESGDDLNGGNTHAWVQAYVPGPGWIDFDPSGGVIGNQRHVRVAVVPHPRAAIPLQGTWYGEASDHRAMKVAVKVKAAAGAGT
jgi:transglutaminase-like putative cysteine protease